MSNSIVTYQVLFEVAKMLKDLQSDPKALDKAAKESYQLGKVEAERAARARLDITTNNELLKQLDVNSTKLKLEYAAFETVKQDFEKLKDKHATELKLAQQNLDGQRAAHAENADDLKKRLKALTDKEEILEADLAAREQELKKGLQSLAIKNQTIEDRVAELNKRQVELDQKHEAVNAYEANLKARAAKLRQQTEGL